MNKLALRAMLLLLVLCFAACAPKQTPQVSIKGGKIGVAAFTQPRRTGELLAGSIPETYHPIAPEVLLGLDNSFDAIFAEHKVDVLEPHVVQRCREIVLDEEKSERMSALASWIRTGECAGVDFVMVPQALLWQERQGGEWGVDQPAAVIIDVFVVDVKARDLAGRFRYEEHQRSLSENMLDAGKFFRRGGKWLKAMDLAREGMNQALERFGI